MTSITHELNALGLDFPSEGVFVAEIFGVKSNVFDARVHFEQGRTQYLQIVHKPGEILRNKRDVNVAVQARVAGGVGAIEIRRLQANTGLLNGGKKSVNGL